MTELGEWRPDPTGRFALRRWEGAGWTQFVQTRRGERTVDRIRPGDPIDVPERVVRDEQTGTPFDDVGADGPPGEVPSDADAFASLARDASAPGSVPIARPPAARPRTSRAKRRVSRVPDVRAYAPSRPTGRSSKNRSLAVMGLALLLGIGAWAWIDASRETHDLSDKTPSRRTLTSALAPRTLPASTSAPTVGSVSANDVLYMTLPDGYVYTGPPTAEGNRGVQGPAGQIAIVTVATCVDPNAVACALKTSPFTATTIEDRSVYRYQLDNLAGLAWKPNRFELLVLSQDPAFAEDLLSLYIRAFA